VSNLGQDIVSSFIQHTWEFIKSEGEIKKIKKMSPQEFQQWRDKELKKMHEEAVRMARLSSDKDLAKRGQTRDDSIRVYEVLMRGRRGIELGKCLLDGMDVRSLDMSKVKPGHISQEHMNRAVGDANTKLPSDLKAPASWR
jgi:hypothetical protein